MDGAGRALRTEVDGELLVERTWSLGRLTTEHFGNGVTNLLRFWLGDFGYGPFLERLANGEIEYQNRRDDESRMLKREQVLSLLTG